ncbi:hypothetical protein JCM8208_005329 [Rhodotorula glutinis]
MSPLPPVLDSPSYDPALSSRSSASSSYSAHPGAHLDDHDPSALPGPPRAARINSGRAKGPPMRSSTMQDDYYAGPGEPSALTRGKAPAQHANGQFGAIGQGYPAPRAPGGLYSQGNHSSPSLALGANLPEDVPPIPSSSSTFSPFDVPDLPPIPAVDDLNIGLENMRFEQRRPSSLEHPLPHRPTPQGGGRRYSPNAAVLGSGGYGSVGQDGAMEIRRAGDDLASVYSVDSAGPGPAQGGGGGGGTWVAHSGGPSGTHTRTTSTSSSPYSAGHASSSSDAQLAYKRDSLSTASIIDGYGDVEPPHAHAHGQGPRPSSVASFLPYDDPYGGMQQSQHAQQHPQHQHQHQPYPGSGADYFGGGQQQAAPGPSTGYCPPGGESAYFSGGAPQHGGGGGYPGGVPAHLGGSGVGAHGSAAAAYAQQQQQYGQAPGHGGGGGGGWGAGGPGAGYDYQAAAAARNPYYAAATGQLGLDPVVGGASAATYPGSLHRGVSSASSMSMGGASLAPPSVANSLARSQSSLHVPGGPMRRKPTSGSTATVNSMASGASASSSSGPPITKASVDDYRQRIKADPDPEAQFNFAKYLIEAAKKINSSAAADEKSAKKYRDALLAESLKLIKRLATQGSGLGKPAYADAQFFLANCLGNGSLGLQIDHEKAYNLYVQASKQNHSAATYRTAVCNEVGAGTRRDHARAVLFYRKASALGDTAGMYKLGMILLHGLLGQQRNPKEGLAWLRRAASQADDENPHALHELGLLHEKPPPLLSAAAATLNAKAQAAAGAAPSSAQAANPTLVAYDPAQAREFFTQAAQLGYPASQFKLGACYEYGTLTCPIDPRRSIAWYTRAAERGDPDAELALSGWYLTGSEGVLKQSDSEAYLWARRAANKGLPKAEYAVGYYSEVGIGVKADLEEAKRWYMRAAAQGNKRAMQRLTELKKLGADKRGAAGGKKRPTRKDAETECVVM